jgi:Golgi-body localisation protein domain
MKTGKLGKKVTLSNYGENNSNYEKTDKNIKYEEFNFSPVGVFFKANSLCYRKHKKYKIRSNEEDTLRIFNHFLTVKGCKLLVS